MTPEILYKATNNGLDIIYFFYPQSRSTEGRANEKFRIRETDKTPSAAMKMYDGVWKVTDFGGSGVALSPIDICMLEKNMSFREALFFLAAEFNVEAEGFTKTTHRADIRKRPATDTEKDGEIYFDFKDKMTGEELSILGPTVSQSDCDALNYKSVNYYTKTKGDETTVFSSNENYPIFVRECNYKDAAGKSATFYKIYQPLAYDKKWRFFYHGSKPRHYLNGLLELQQAYEKDKKDQEKTKEYQEAVDEKRERSYVYSKIPRAVICSGERDALCLKSFGYHPIWLNSETDSLQPEGIKEISLCVDRIYNIPDLDETGVRQGKQLAKKYISIYTIWLPNKLNSFKDRRGNPRKDFRDFCDIWNSPKDVENLFNIARPIQFWEYVNSGKGKRLEVNSDYLEYFLYIHGFVCIEDKNSRTGQMFAQIEGNVVREVTYENIKNFLKKYVYDRHEPVEIRNLINNSARISESSITLKTVELEFENHTEHSQTFFFKNAIWEVTANGVTEYKHGQSKRYVWEDELLEHNVTRLDRSFEIEDISSENDKEPIFDVKINPNHTSKFFQFLVNASRIYWRKEFEPDNEPELSEETKLYKEKYKFAIDGPRLNSIEIREQKQHLLNKIFCLGYLLHRFKAENRAWCVFAMDNKIGADNESNGGSGKSCCFKAPKLFMKSVSLPGRNNKLTDNNHIFERVTEHTGYILIDDAQQYINFGFFFDSVTGDINVNPKNAKSYEIPFSKAAKFCITSNYVLRNTDPSTARRILYAVFSDYYHQKTEKNDYLESRTIYDDFNKNLFSINYTEEEWNADINFFADAEHTYLSLVRQSMKIQPPMENVVLRGLLAEMGDQFYNWAIIYFAPNSENCDKLMSKQLAFKTYQKETGQYKWQMNKFTVALKAFAEYADYVIQLDPNEFKNSQGRISRKAPIFDEKTLTPIIDPKTGKPIMKTTEMFYLQTKEDLNPLDLTTNINEDEDTNENQDSGSDELPFYERTQEENDV